jgi:hypothetical protein
MSTGFAGRLIEAVATLLSFERPHGWKTSARRLGGP